MNDTPKTATTAGLVWYHGSVAHLAPGTILTGQPRARRNFRQSRDCVSITTEYRTALHWAREAATRHGHDHVHVYRVHPLAPVDGWRVGGTGVHYEANTDQAEIIEMVFGHGTDLLPPPGDVAEFRRAHGHEPTPGHIAWVSGFTREPNTGGLVPVDQTGAIPAPATCAQPAG